MVSQLLIAEKTGASVVQRAAELFEEQWQAICRRTDRTFAGLMIFQWIAGIVAAYVISPTARSGPASQIHPHVWAAVLLGGAITALPVALAFFSCIKSLHEMRAIAEKQAKQEGSFEEARVTARELEDSEERMRLIVENALDAVITFDAEGIITAWNPQAEEIFGWTQDSAIGRELSQLVVSPDHRNAHHARMWGYLSTEEGPVLNRRIETTAVNSEGHDFPIELSISDAKVRGKQVFSAFVRDITDRKQAEDLMQQAKETAEAANKAKSEFLSRMSHELRTPLNAVLGFGQLLEMQDLSPENQESVEQILTGGRHLLVLINEVLDIARVESGNLSVSLEPVSVRDAVEEALMLMRSLAAQRNVALYPLPKDLEDLHVRADRQRIKQILLNLMANAIKYNRDGGCVLVSYWNAPGDTVVIRVRDSGTGIPPGMMSRLFTPFDRLSAENGGEEGTGLGLALTKKLVEAMDGKAWAESEYGTGSSFFVKLVRMENPAAAVGDHTGLALTTPDVLDERPTVLYIEDNLSNVRLVEHVLGKQANVVSAMQGSVGLDLIHECRPRLVLLDIHLPDMSGHEVLDRLRRDPESKTVPVVVVSADATPGQVDRLLFAGANHYLTKPFDLKELVDVVDQLLAAA